MNSSTWLVVVSALATLFTSACSHPLFDAYVLEFSRQYSHGTDEYATRSSLFQQRVQTIEAHNAKPERLWSAAVNHLTDRTEGELEQLRGWRYVHHGSKHGASSPVFISDNFEVFHGPDDEVDWRRLNMASQVPDQGGCGSCWAVATASMLQGRYEVQMKSNRTFSAQQLVDCVPNPKGCGGTGGCSGATVELAMQYVQEAGLLDETAAPYTGQESTTCDQPIPTAPIATSFLAIRQKKEHADGGARMGLQKWRKLPENQALPLMHALADGPVAVSAAAADWAMYGDGIFGDCKNDAVIDHAVVLFGYGTDAGSKYWTIRNSWSDVWGEHGFIRLLRHDTPEEDDAFCGTDNDPKSGIACKPYPEAVKVCGMCGILYDSVAAHFAPQTRGEGGLSMEHSP